MRNLVTIKGISRAIAVNDREIASLQSQIRLIEGENRRYRALPREAYLRIKHGEIENSKTIKFLKSMVGAKQKENNKLHGRREKVRRVIESKPVRAVRRAFAARRR